MMLDPKALIERAKRGTGLSQFGPDPFEDGLTVLCASLDHEAGLTDKGRAGAADRLVAALSERLRADDWLRRHPEILEAELPPQVFVVGLPRTGTTALSQFLSEDPAARSIRRWELNSLTPPSPPPAPNSPPATPPCRRCAPCCRWRRRIRPSTARCSP
jgi:hypothetical protein